MLPQPPPDAPAPLPSDAAILSRKKWRWLLIVGLICVALVLIGLMNPVVIRSPIKSDVTEAVSNARQIGLALFEFDAEYGRFPDASTISAVNKDEATNLDPGRLILGAKSSNDFFRQLFASGITQSEMMFYARIAGCHKADNRIFGVHALEKGECGFSYLAGLSSKGNPARPIVVTPLIPGTDRFDPTRFDGMAVVLRIDNSVIRMSIDRDGHVMMFGKNLLDPTNPVWGKDDKFVIAWPE